MSKTNRLFSEMKYSQKRLCNHRLFREMLPEETLHLKWMGLKIRMRSKHIEVAKQETLHFFFYF